MTTYNALRPNTLRNIENPPDSEGFGVEGSKFVIRVHRALLGGNVTLHDITGDMESSSEDDSGLHLHEGMAADSISLQGWCLAGAAIGLANLGDSGATVTLLLSATRRVTGTIKIASYQVNWEQGKTNVPIALAGMFEKRLIESSY